MRAKTYPPLAAVVLIALALAALPSALTLPQTSPTTTLEYAPVPPSERAEAPPGGNLSSLSLATSGSLGRGPGGAEGPGGPGGGARGAGKSPRTKRCVGSPPRQTEDPMSPPCVAFFDGDNFGRTYAGVTAGEIRILHYVDAFSTTSDRGFENEGDFRGGYFDLGRPAERDEPVVVRDLRRFQTYFNDRFQTYGRFARFFVDISSGAQSSTTPESRRADAAAGLREVGPFATLTSDTHNFHETPFVESMASQGVLVFGPPNQGYRPLSFYRQHAPRVWTFAPTLERMSVLFGDYVCTQVVGRVVVDSGNPGHNGGARRLGLLRVVDRTAPELTRLGEVVRDRVAACGGTFHHEATMLRSTTVTGNANSNQRALENMAGFQQAGVTTLVQPGGFEGDHSRAAGRLNYRPEWLLLGEGLTEANVSGAFQDPSVWQHAWVVTPQVRVPDVQTDMCRQALREADPSIGREDEGRVCGLYAPFYADLRQLFTGIQVAGPNLTPAAIDKGFHAIPAKPSTDATVPSCFYEPADYACTKDVTVEFWDPVAEPPVPTFYRTRGCWRMVADGRRHLPGTFPTANIDADARPDNVCNGYT